MLVYRLCISVLLTRMLHLVGLSQINTRWSLTDTLSTRLCSVFDVFSAMYLLHVLFLLLVSV